jgi:hypothetical protein
VSDAGIGSDAAVIHDGMTMPAVVLVARGRGRSGRDHGECCATDDGQRGEQAAEWMTMPIGKCWFTTMMGVRHSLSNRPYAKTLTT